MADSFDLPTKINRAIYALIVGTGVGLPENTFAGDATSSNRKLPNTSIMAGEGFDEGQGNYRFPACKIIFRDKETVQPNDPNPNSAFLAAQTRVSAIIEQLALSDDGTTMDYTRRQIEAYGRQMAVDVSGGTNPVMAQSMANNLDMENFSLIYYAITDYGSAKKVEGLYFEREVFFECLACNSDLDDIQVPDSPIVSMGGQNVPVLMNNTVLRIFDPLLGKFRLIQSVGGETTNDPDPTDP